MPRLGGGSPRSISIKDIAQAAGVSPSTVSRALHGHTRISPETTSRVQRLAHDLGYTPSLPARSLATRRTLTLGMVTSHASDPFLADVILGAEEEARAHGYTLFLSSSARTAERDEAVIRSFYEHRLAGIIVAGSQTVTPYARLQERYPIPIVVVNLPLYPHSVSTDNRAGAQEAAEHLVALGHRRIAFIGCPRSDFTHQSRLAGYLAVLRAHGLSPDPDLLAEGNGELSGGVAAMDRLLALTDPPTAVFAFNDMTAIGVLHSLACAGRGVPRACSVVGFDDLDLAAFCCPPLTTVRQPRYELGQRALRMLLALIQGRDDVQAELLPAHLVVRATTAPAPRHGGVR